nr:MAG TPA: hypothetical protein [Caudoviricetes sp.]
MCRNTHNLFLSLRKDNNNTLINKQYEQNF